MPPFLLFSLFCLTASSVPTYSELPKIFREIFRSLRLGHIREEGIHFPAVPEKEEGEDGREETAMSTTSRKRSASAPEYAKFVTGSDAFGKRKEKKKGFSPAGSSHSKYPSLYTVAEGHPPIKFACTRGF